MKTQQKAVHNIESDRIDHIIKELKSALEPMVPYKVDPLEFCREAHAVKDAHIKNALGAIIEATGATKSL